MDSIERMRRLNELTKELKQRGFAESSFEAIQQANQIYGDDDLTENVKHGLIQNSPHERIAKDSEEGSEMVNTIDIDRKIVKLSENVELLTNKINEIIKALNDMDTRINALKNRPVVEKIIEQPVERQIVHTGSINAGSEYVEGNNHAETKKDEYSVNQRVGNYQSQDVAIDKMFYYGKK